MTLYEKCIITKELNDLFSQVTQKIGECVDVNSDDEKFGKFGAYLECLKLIDNTINKIEEEMNKTMPA